MENNDIADAIKNIIQEINPDIEQNSLDNLDYDAKLKDKLNLDSMDFLDIVMELRKEYKVEVPEEYYMELSTMNGCIKYLKEPLKNKSVHLIYLRKPYFKL